MNGSRRSLVLKGRLDLYTNHDGRQVWCTDWYGRKKVENTVFWFLEGRFETGKTMKNVSKKM